MEISKEEYLRLRVADATLTRLNAGGVDNWEGYGDSLNPEGEESFEVLYALLRHEILA